MHHTQKFCQISFPSKIYTFYACTFQSKVNDFEFESKHDCDEQWLRGILSARDSINSIRWTTVITASRKHTGTLRKRIHFVLCKPVLATYITWNILILTKHTCHCRYFTHYTLTHTQKHLHFLFTFHPLVHQERQTTRLLVLRHNADTLRHAATKQAPDEHTANEEEYHRDEIVFRWRAEDLMSRVLQARHWHNL